MNKKKKNYWPVFFILLFSFVFSMIIWTISKAVTVPPIEDISFMKKYQDVDASFNNMMDSNELFSKKYDFEIYINGNKLDLTTEDIRYSQKVIDKNSTHKNILKVGNNDIKVVVLDKNTKEKKDLGIELLITKALVNDSDIIFNNNSFKNESKEYTTTFTIKEANNWIITGTFKVEDTTGYIYIKTNAN